MSTMPITMKWGTPINFITAGGNPVITAGGNPVITAGGNPVITAVETLLLWQVFFMLWGLLSLHSYPVQMESSSPFQIFSSHGLSTAQHCHNFITKPFPLAKKTPHITVSSFFFFFFFLADTSFLIAESWQLCGRHPIIS